MEDERSFDWSPLESSAHGQPAAALEELDIRANLIEELQERLQKGSATEQKAWDEATKILHEHSKEMVQKWLREIDALPIFAGLFSTVLTAFNVQTYQLLKPAPIDPSLVLIQISAQLASFSVNPSFLNSSQPSYAVAVPTIPFEAPAYAIWLNACWFSSLVLSVASASMGIIVKQWLNIYEEGLSGQSLETATFRQHRWKNLMKWQVPAIVAILPALLQVAVMLFLAGLVIFLWSIHPTVAAVVSTLVAALLAFTLFTIFLPAFRDDCCYLSSLSYAAYHLVDVTKWTIRRLLYAAAIETKCTVRAWRNTVSFSRLKDILRFVDRRLPWPEDPIRGPSTLRGREQDAVAERFSSIDEEMLYTAYKISMEPRCFDNAMTCLAKNRSSVTRYHDLILGHLADHWSQNRSKWPVETFRDYIHLAALALRRTWVEPDWEWATKLLDELLTTEGPPAATANVDDLNDLLYFTSLMAMDPQCPDSPLAYLFASLEPKTTWKRRYTATTLRWVAAAARYTLGQSPISRSVNPSATGPRVSLQKGPGERDFASYTMSVKLAVRCIARPIRYASEEEGQLAFEHVKAILESFTALLRSGVWKTLCRHRDVAVVLVGAMEELSYLMGHSHSRPLLSTSLLEALEVGIIVYESAKDRADENNDDTVEIGYYVEMRRELRVMRLWRSLQYVRNCVKEAEKDVNNQGGGTKEMAVGGPAPQEPSRDTGVAEPVPLPANSRTVDQGAPTGQGEEPGTGDEGNGQGEEPRQTPQPSTHMDRIVQELSGTGPNV